MVRSAWEVKREKDRQAAIERGENPDDVEEHEYEEAEEGEEEAAEADAPLEAPLSPAGIAPDLGERILPLEVLRWDTHLTMGQTRTLCPLRVARLKASVTLRKPTGYVGILAWDATGMRLVS